MVFNRKSPKRVLSPEAAMLRVAQLCSASEMCRQEAVDKCLQWGLEEQQAHEVADRLVGERFIDDARYAPLYVRDKARFSGWGPIKVRTNLIQKGVDPNLADDAIEAFRTGFPHEWDQILCRALKSKLRTARQDDPQKLYASLVRFAMQRGFTFDTIRPALRTVLNEAQAEASDHETIEENSEEIGGLENDDFVPNGF